MNGTLSLKSEINSLFFPNLILFPKYFKEIKLSLSKIFKIPNLNIEKSEFKK